MIWYEQTNYFNNCYFYLTNTAGIPKNKTDYPAVPSVIRPVPQGEDLLVSTPLLDWEDVIPELHDDKELHTETEY